MTDHTIKRDAFHTVSNKIKNFSLDDDRIAERIKLRYMASVDAGYGFPKSDFSDFKKEKTDFRGSTAELSLDYLIEIPRVPIIRKTLFASPVEARFKGILGESFTLKTSNDAWRLVVYDAEGNSLMETSLQGQLNYGTGGGLFP